MRRITPRKDRRNRTCRKGDFWFAKGRRTMIRKLLRNDLAIAHNLNHYQELRYYIALRGGVRRARQLVRAGFVTKGRNWNHVNRVILSR